MTFYEIEFPLGGFDADAVEDALLDIGCRVHHVRRSRR